METDGFNRTKPIKQNGMELNFDKLTEAEKEILRPFLKNGDNLPYLNPKVVNKLVDRGLLTAHYNEAGFVLAIVVKQQVIDHLSECPSLLD